MTNAIEAEGLEKRYGATPALLGLDLTVPAGHGPRRPRSERGREDDRRPDPRHAARRRPGTGPGRRVRRRRPRQPRSDVGSRSPASSRPSTSGSAVARTSSCSVALPPSWPGRDAAHRRAARSVRAHRRGRTAGPDLLGRHAPAARPGGRAAARSPRSCSSTSRRPGSIRAADSPSGSSSRSSSLAGTTVLLTTQNLDEADRLADQIVVIDRGQAIASRHGQPSSRLRSVASVSS